MLNLKTKLFFFLILLFTLFGFFFHIPVPFDVSAQQPTGNVPTVTGTPAGAIVQALIDQSNEIVPVYSGPNAFLYPQVGVILMGQEIPAYGISQDGEWIQIYYPGIPESVAWVFGPYVRFVEIGNLPVLPAPSTPTLVATPTINPTLEAAFIPDVTQTRLPTFTPAPEIIVATFLPEEEVNRVPTGLLILALGFIGGFGVLISFLRGR
jgi:hypothetical protein